ncbi:MAG: radical SAM family heme chaperone HemW [Candidatus Onthovivens sp.]|nr:radical SAM family heme chaperone HemW [Candidatus Onthovivens sp.]
MLMMNKFKKNLVNTKRIIKRKINSLYIHIPFCNKICSYCSFSKMLYFPKIARKYICNLIVDLKKVKQNFNKFKTIYIGGGTPSSLSISLLENLLKYASILLLKNGEFTFEANLDSLTEEKLKILKKYGVNRLSIGIETSSNKYLSLMNREYDFDINKKMELVKKYFTNFNLDLIYGLPNETLLEVKKDLEFILNFKPKHISIYALEVNPNSKFYIDGIKEEKDEILRKQYDFVVNFLKKNGYNRYEVSNFALKGYKSRHNINYRKDNEYVAIGTSSSGFIDNIRYVNSSSISDYIKGKRNKETEIITKTSDKTYYILTNLRLEEGFKLSDYKRKFNEDFYLKKKEVIDDLVKHNVLIMDKDRIRVAADYIYVLDSIVVKLI